MIIGLTGVMRSGKSTICDILRDKHGFVIVGFADALKSMAKAIDPIVGPGGAGLAGIVKTEGWEAAKDRYPEVRRFLQRLGTEGVRGHLGQDAWVDAWRLTVEPLVDADVDVAVPDVRFLNEAHALTGQGGEVWRVVRPGFGGSLHASEIEMEQIEPTTTIFNNSSEDALAYHVEQFLAEARRYA